MAEAVSVTVRLQDFKRYLDAFGNEFERKTVRSSTNAMAQVFKEAVIKHAPILRKAREDRVSGTLKRAIYVFRSRDSNAGRERYVISFRKGPKAAKKGKDAFYGRYLEEGWVPRGPGRKIRGGRRLRALQRERQKKGSKKRITEYQFIEPAFREAGSAALRAFNARIEERLLREAKR